MKPKVLAEVLSAFRYLTRIAREYDLNVGFLYVGRNERKIEFFSNLTDAERDDQLRSLFDGRNGIERSSVPRTGARGTLRRRGHIPLILDATDQAPRRPRGHQAPKAKPAGRRPARKPARGG